MFLSPTNTIFMSNYLRFACCYPYSSHTCHSSHESHWSDVNSPFDWLARGAAVNLELVDQWWRWSPPWFTWNFKRNIWKRKRRTWKQELRVKDRKHTKIKIWAGNLILFAIWKTLNSRFSFVQYIFLMCLHFWFMLFIFRSVTALFAILKMFAFVFRFCALLFYTCFKFFYLRLLFFDPWLQYFWREYDPIPYLPLKQWVVQFDNEKCYLSNYVLLMCTPTTTLNPPLQ